MAIRKRKAAGAGHTHGRGDGTGIIDHPQYTAHCPTGQDLISLISQARRRINAAEAAGDPARANQHRAILAELKLLQWGQL